MNLICKGHFYTPTLMKKSTFFNRTILNVVSNVIPNEFFLCDDKYYENTYYTHNFLRKSVHRGF